MSDPKGTAVRINAVGSKTGYYADRVYLYGLVFFLASQACILTNSVPVLFYYLLFYAGAVLLAAAGLYRIFFALFRDLKKAIPALGILLFCAAYFIYSARVVGITDAMPFLITGFAIAGAIDAKADHILITGIIGNLVMILNNVYMSFVRSDDLFVNLYAQNDFFFFGYDRFYFHRMNNRSSTDWASHYFWIIIAYLWIRGKKITWGEIFAVGALNLLVYSLTGSVTSLICISLAFVIAVIYKLYLTFKGHPGDKNAPAKEQKGAALLKTGENIIGYCVKYSFVIFAVIMILFTVLYDFGDPFFYKLNDLLHQRLALGQRGFIEHGVHLFSSGVPIYGNLSTIDDFYNFVDSSYISILIRMGLIPFVFYLGSMTVVQLRHKKYIYGALLLAVCALSCVEEHHMAEIPYNFFILMMFADLGIEKTGNVPAASKKKNNSGTLNMAAAVLGIIFCAASVFVIYPRYKAVKELDRLDKKASDVYDSVQKNLDALSLSGKWQQQTSQMNSYQYGETLTETLSDYLYLTGKEWSDMISDPKAHSFYSVYYDPGEGTGSYGVLEMLISDETRNIIGDGSVIIEYDAIEGKVYSVWYSEQSGCRIIPGGRWFDRAERLRLKEGTEGYYRGGYNG